MNWKLIGVGIALLLALAVFSRQSTSHRFAEPQGMQSPGEQLLEAAGMGDTAIVQALVDTAVDINVKDRTFGYTPLIVAARQGHIDIVQILLERGADVEATDNYGSTALYWAKKNQREEIVQLLLEAGARDEPVPLEPITHSQPSVT